VFRSVILFLPGKIPNYAGVFSWLKIKGELNSAGSSAGCKMVA